MFMNDIITCVKTLAMQLQSLYFSWLWPVIDNEYSKQNYSFDLSSV